MRDYKEYKEIIESKLTSYLPDTDKYASILRESMNYSLTVGGKRLRPVLLLAACEFNNGNITDAIPYACAVEYIHTYSLIHDDLPAMDNDDLRRGKPTNHKVYGDDIAILAGDALLNTASEIMYSEMLNCSDNMRLVNHAKAGHSVMAHSGALGMIGGQVADVVNENNSGTSSLVRFIEEHKTADLIIAPIQAGLYLSGAEMSIIRDFTDYGLNLGVAFQILDDILDFEGDAAIVGKTLGKDLDQDKCNYVCVHGLSEAKEELHNATLRAINSVEKYGERADFFIDLAKSLEIRNK